MQLIDNQWADYVYPVLVHCAVDSSKEPRYYESLDTYLREMELLIVRTVGETDRMVVPVCDQPRFMATAFAGKTRFAFAFEDTRELVFDASVTLLMPVPRPEVRH